MTAPGPDQMRPTLERSRASWPGQRGLQPPPAGRGPAVDETQAPLGPTSCGWWLTPERRTNRDTGKCGVGARGGGGEGGRRPHLHTQPRGQVLAPREQSSRARARPRPPHISPRIGKAGGCMGGEAVPEPLCTATLHAPRVWTELHSHAMEVLMCVWRVRVDYTRVVCGSRSVRSPQLCPGSGGGRGWEQEPLCTPPNPRAS